MSTTLRPPTPGRRLTPPRPVKLQVCLTEAERAHLDELARAHRYDSVAAYIRARALGSVSDDAPHPGAS